MAIDGLQAAQDLTVRLIPGPDCTDGAQAAGGADLKAGISLWLGLPRNLG